MYQSYADKLTLKIGEIFAKFHTCPKPKRRPHFNFSAHLSETGEYDGHRTQTDFVIQEERASDFAEIQRAFKPLIRRLGITSDKLLSDDVEAYRKFKKADPELYQKWMKLDVLKGADEGLGSKPRDYCFIVTPRHEIDGAMYALSKYLIVGTCDGTGKDILADARVVVMHQDRFLIEKTMEAVKGYFARALKATEERELIQSVGMMRFLFAHACPYYRGSAAIGEWLEQVVYQFKGHRLTFASDYKGDLEALTSFRAEEFMAKYQETTALT